MKREFYYQNDTSNKFWTIELIGNCYVTTHGRIGTKPRETRKEFSDKAKAESEFNKQIASKLKKGYAEGSIVEATEHVKPDWAGMTMSEDLFWRIIGLLNWKKIGDDEAVIKPVIRVLSEMSVEDIFRFEDILSNKLYALDTEAHAREIGQDSYKPDKHFSVDAFLYVRACVVANGKDIFESALADPTLMPKDADFEPILYMASEAYELKTGRKFEYNSPVDYETFSNKAGWQG